MALYQQYLPFNNNGTILSNECLPSVMKIFKTAAAIFSAIIILVSSSCANTKKDCMGHQKHRQANGVWL